MQKVNSNGFSKDNDTASRDSYWSEMNQKYLDLIDENPEFLGVQRYCNICGFRFSKFLNFYKSVEARCPLCRSLERHRHIYVYLAALYPFLEGKKVLHFAPEPIFKKIILDSGADYYDADINPKKATYRCDITDIGFGDDSFDFIMCIHVLEHIIDDTKAMSELYRVLKPGGTALLSVPLAEKLHEDYSIVSREEREKHFGQWDHVRLYDLKTFLERLNKAGFSTSVAYPEKLPKEFLDSTRIGTDLVARKVIFARKGDGVDDFAGIFT